MPYASKYNFNLATQFCKAVEILFPLEIIIIIEILSIQASLQKIIVEDAFSHLHSWSSTDWQRELQRMIEKDQAYPHL